ncbi:hypothetical protein [Streptomyces chartreusis]|uniref:hypothetical protein n=1 Tax=Streptomyces chartreusis TaxID=1969 RepID=UPI003816F07A
MSNSISDYAEVTAKVRRLGDRMHTSPLAGTAVEELTDGINSLIFEKGYGGELAASWHDLRGAHDVSKRLVELTRGGQNTLLAIMSNYNFAGERLRAHMVTIAGVRGLSTGSATVTFNDPDDNDNLLTQSARNPHTHQLGSDDGNGVELIGFGAVAGADRLESVVVVGPTAH